MAKPECSPSGYPPRRLLIIVLIGQLIGTPASIESSNKRVHLDLARNLAIAEGVKQSLLLYYIQTSSSQRLFQWDYIGCSHTSSRTLQRTNLTEHQPSEFRRSQSSRDADARLCVYSITPSLFLFQALKHSFSASPSHRILLQDWLHGFPGLFSDTSELSRFLLFSFSVFPLLVVGSVR